jgi:hypothetical protein
MALDPTSIRHRVLQRRRHASARPAASTWSLLALLVLGACDPDAIGRIPTPGKGDSHDSSRTRPRPQPEPKGSTSSDDEVCTEDNPDWYGCPGNPCAHGWCFVGECVGEVVGEDGMLVDPGVCCVDEECLEPSR